MSLIFTELNIRGSDLGVCNPTVDINNVSYIHASYALSDSAKKHKPKYFGEGMVDSMLPYLQQDNYGRKLSLKSFKVAVLENENLKAVILTELGGRLYSLTDKKSGRELLYTNPVFRPANLSLRNAWFSGGVEWNVSIKGHNPLTCSPLFAVAVEADGEEGLRVYEFERKRKVVYSVDFFLPKGAETLLVIPRIENTEKEDKYTYWWSNIAVPEENETRVLVPAKNSFVSRYLKNKYFVDYLSVPVIDGRDTSYPSNAVRPNDFFYDIPEESDKWICAVDKSGKGLIQISTSLLKGRKMFVWGRGAGGKNWQKFLTDEGVGGYTEIQAGLAETQLQHLPMASESELCWAEEYGAIDIGCEAHGEYSVAVDACERALRKRYPLGAERTLNERIKKYGDGKVVQFLQFGSGWGALQNALNRTSGGNEISKRCSFPKESLTDEQKPFCELLENGYMSEADEQLPVKGYGSGETLKNLLEKSLGNEKGNNWFALYHLGVICYELGQKEKAEKYWNESYNKKPNGWAMRNLAMIDKCEYKNLAGATEKIMKAVELTPNFSIIKDCATILIQAKEYEKCIKTIDGVPAEMLENGRLKFYKAYCLNKLGRNLEASKIINYDFTMTDLKEGEVSVSELWYDIYGELLFGKENTTEEEKIEGVDEKMPLGKLDFRME